MFPVSLPHCVSKLPDLFKMPEIPLIYCLFRLEA